LINAENVEDMGVEEAVGRCVFSSHFRLLSGEEEGRYKLELQAAFFKKIRRFPSILKKFQNF